MSGELGREMATGVRSQAFLLEQVLEKLRVFWKRLLEVRRLGLLDRRLR